MKFTEFPNGITALREGEEIGMITSPGDFARLTVVDWNRYRPYWNSPMHAVDVLGRSFLGFRYHIIPVNLSDYPRRDDFPEWHHIGSQHTALGRLFWNYFQHEFSGAHLDFHDQPDISGYVFDARYTPAKREFWGDIGKVSPITLFDIIPALFFPVFWFSVIDERTLVTLEAPPPEVMKRV